MNRFLLKGLASVCALAVMFGTVSCSDDDKEPLSPLAVVIEGTEAQEVVQGATMNLKAVVEGNSEVQYVWTLNGKEVSTTSTYDFIATDLGKYNDYIIENLQGLDALLLEANHDIRMLQVGKYPYYLKQRILGDRGHLSNENAGRLLCRLLHDNLKAIFLGHLSRENNYEELAYETVCSEVTLGDNPYKSKDFRIQVAKRDFVSDVVTV